MTRDDDGTMGDLYREQVEASKAKRKSNREYSARLLTEAGIAFETHNGGAHLVVAGRYDFWPGTGLWMARGDRSKNRGVRRLIARIQRQGATP
jgi:hypothetical protein